MAETCNDFLGGQLRIWQPAQGYRAGVDAVLLASAVPARAGDSVLDLGCGVGVAGLCVAARVPGVALTGLELQAGYAAMARRNGAGNGVDFEVVEGDLAQMPPALRERQFTHVIANPPYFDRAASTAASDSGREVAMGEDTPLETWVRVAAKRAAPKGTVTFIHRAERLPDLLAGFVAHLGSVQIIPLIPRRGRPARLVIVQGRKGGRAAPVLHDGWLLHQGNRHEVDGDDYTPETSAILRGGAAMMITS